MLNNIGRRVNYKSGKKSQSKKNAFNRIGDCSQLCKIPDFLEELDLSETDLTDHDLHSLKVSNLLTLNLTETTIYDIGSMSENCPNLELLLLRGTQIGDKQSFQKFAALKKIELNAQASHCIEEISKLESLTELDLKTVPLNIDNIRHLVSAPRLKAIYIKTSLVDKLAILALGMVQQKNIFSVHCSEGRDYQYNPVPKSVVPVIHEHIPALLQAENFVFRNKDTKEYKIVVIGDENGGRTDIWNILSNVREDTESIKGLDYRIVHRTIDTARLKLNIWNTHDPSLRTNADAFMYIVVFDALDPESVEIAKYCLQQTSLKNPRAGVLLVSKSGAKESPLSHDVLYNQHNIKEAFYEKMRNELENSF
eukprot:TRINITY_DN11176_c0_g1_i1.p1 TRINITY_DN11176_c0_g1~~TRINITY_DN11176_c0_g1_i1.p1  ORF type:complete len:366 (-),score=78.70 TRINITY_DN11176_c0_g1_i1:11-1108(-)